MMPQETGFAESAARAIAAAVVVPVIRTPTAEEALEVAEWAIEQGLPAIELTATTPGLASTRSAACGAHLARDR